MMPCHHYTIARHPIEVCFASEGLHAESLLPSFLPFKSEAEEDLLFRMTVWQGEGPDFSAWQEIGQFDCGGANHGVWRSETGAYGFEISLPDVSGGLLSCRLKAEADFSRCEAWLMPAERAGQQQFGLNNALMMAYAFAAAAEDTLLVHASVIRKDGYGYLFTAPSGTGKSTHTHLWYKHLGGCDLMNDDNPVIRVVDGQALVFGSPWSGKTPCYRNVFAPIGAITQIAQAPVNEVRRLGAVEAFAALLPAVSSMKWDKRVYGGICQALSRLLNTVPVWHLDCRPDAEAAHVCYEAIHR